MTPQHLKNAKSRIFKGFTLVPREICLILTGTPLHNSTEELCTHLNFSDSDTFESKEALLDENYGQIPDAKQLSELHKFLRPYLIWRMKEDVNKSLPQKEETMLEVTPTRGFTEIWKKPFLKNKK